MSKSVKSAPNLNGESAKPELNASANGTGVNDAKPKRIGRLEIIEALNNAYSDKPTQDGKKLCAKKIQEYLKQIINEYPDLDQKYNILIINDTGMIVPSDADKIYNSVTTFVNGGVLKPILLILYSSGGLPGSAYLIGKLSLEFSNNNLVITIPRHAKSAATLLCCAANEIHMGSLSELGPIDPQINEMPALGLKNAVHHIAELVKSFPESAVMFANYLNLSLPLIDLGYYERAAESAKQYAEQLLNTHAGDLPSDPESIATDLVYKYKDHGFVIDKTEAKKIFGNIIKTNTQEYELGNKIYLALDFIRAMANAFSHHFYFIGGVNSDPNFTKKLSVAKSE